MKFELWIDARRLRPKTEMFYGAHFRGAPAARLCALAKHRKWAAETASLSAAARLQSAPRAVPSWSENSRISIFRCSACASAPRTIRTSPTVQGAVCSAQSRTVLTTFSTLATLFSTCTAELRAHPGFCSRRPSGPRGVLRTCERHETRRCAVGSEVQRRGMCSYSKALFRDSNAQLGSGRAGTGRVWWLIVRSIGRSIDWSIDWSCPLELICAIMPGYLLSEA